MSDFQKINPESVKKPSYSYSNGVLIPLGTADLMFVAGQLAQEIDGTVVAPNDAKAQTKYVFDCISDILADGGMTLNDVVKVQIFITNMVEDFPKISKVRDEIFKTSKPVSTAVEVSRLGVPGCCVEIEVTAIRLK